MSDLASLKILYRAFNNSLEDDDLKTYAPIDSLKIGLRRHQHAVIERMREYENISLNGNKIKNSTLYSKYGILGDSVGVGKTFMVLGHIGLIKANRNVIDFPSFNINSNRNMYSLESTIIKDISKK
jgi:hypothetical protein